MSPQAVWRVYLPEWAIVYTSKAKGPDGMAECADFFRARYEGRVRRGDGARVEPASRVRPEEWEYRLMLKLPNRRGEFRDPGEAERFADELGPEARVVARFSDKEKRLLAYGTRLLHDGQ